MATYAHKLVTHITEKRTVNVCTVINHILAIISTCLSTSSWHIQGSASSLTPPGSVRLACASETAFRTAAPPASDTRIERLARAPSLDGCARLVLSDDDAGIALATEARLSEVAADISTCMSISPC